MQINLFKEFLQIFLNVIKSRLFILILVFTGLFFILLVRIFNLQIVNGESYLNDYLYMAERTLAIPSTRGNIYDRNGTLLAYNELAYAVIIEDNGNYKNSTQKNRALNQTIYETIKIIEKNGDSIINDLSIIIDSDGEFVFTASSDIANLRFLRDAYGKKTIDELDKDGKTLSTSTAKDVFLYLCSESRYNILTDFNTGEMSPEQLKDKTIYSIEDALKILTIRYSMSSNSFQKYVTTTIASAVNEKTVAAILENKAQLQGVTIKEETLRKYVDGEYFAHIIGYTGRASADELEEFQKAEEGYALNDVVGKYGIELEMELELQGKKGSETVFVDSLGKILDTTSVTDPLAGNDVYLALDYNLQKEVYDSLERHLAGILVSKIVNYDVTIKTTTPASARYIPVKDVYYALINNNIIDINQFIEADASETEKNVYNIFLNKQASVISRVVQELTSESPIIYSKLDDETKIYMSYIYTMLASKGNNVLLEDKIDTKDSTYIAWKKDDSISLQEFLLYAITQNWIDTSKLNVENKYSNTEEVYQALTDYIQDKLVNDTNFNKLLYKYMIKNYTITGSQICLILFEQNVLEYNEEDFNSLTRGNSYIAYNFIVDKISKLEITPAQLAIEPFSGSVIVTGMEGEVLALVTYPSYDNNMLSGSVDADYYNGLQNDLSLPLYNRATMTGTAPGSTYKMITAIAGLEEGVITPYEEIRDLGVFDKITPTVKCWVYPGNHGLETVREALRDSCNYFFYEVGYRLSTDSDGKFNSGLGLSRIAKYADMFGFNSYSGVELSESFPKISDQNSVPTSIGQGNNKFTNVQLARYITTLANSGNNYELTLLDKLADSDGNTIKTYSAPLSNTVDLAESTWNSVHSGMRSVATEGSVRSIFKDFPISVAGKTGTAQQDLLKPNHALFVSYAPYEDPEIGVSVLIPNGYASSYAAEITKDVLKIYFNIEDDVDSNSAVIPESNIQGD